MRADMELRSHADLLGVLRDYLFESRIHFYYGNFLNRFEVSIPKSGISDAFHHRLFF